MRTRTFLVPEKAQMLGCDRQMVQREMCSATVPLCEGSHFSTVGKSCTKLSANGTISFLVECDLHNFVRNLPKC